MKIELSVHAVKLKNVAGAFKGTRYDRVASRRVVSTYRTVLGSTPTLQLYNVLQYKLFLTLDPSPSPCSQICCSDPFVIATKIATDPGARAHVIGTSHYFLMPLLFGAKPSSSSSSSFVRSFEDHSPAHTHSHTK